MADPSYVTTAEVSQALGVSVSTVKRWVDDGILPAHRTAGGHRKLLRADVLRLAREGRLPRLDLARLGEPGETSAGEGLDRLGERLFQSLRDGSRADVRSILLHAYRQGMAMGILADRLLAPAMSRIGHDWETGRIDVLHEHRATQLCVDAIHELKQLLSARADANGPLAVGGAPEGDVYVLSGLMVECTLLDAGWRCINLGANVPLASLALACKELRPRVLWLSCSDIVDPDRFVLEFDELMRAAGETRVAVAVGGRALNEKIRSRMRYSMFGDGLEQFTSFLRTLHAQPSPPKRGRPSGAAR